MLDFKFNVIDDAQAIKDLMHQIEVNSSYNIFQSAYWLANSIDENNISFTATNSDGKICKALHVKIRRKFGFKIAELADEPYGQYSDVVSTDGQPSDEFFEKSLDYLKANGVDAMHLLNVRADANIYQYCQKHGETLADKQAPWIDLKAYENYEAYFNSASKTTRKIYRKFFRDLDVETKSYIDEEISPELVEEVLQLKSKQLANNGQTSRVFADEKNVACLAEIFTNPTPDFKTHIGTCRCDGKMVAAAISHVKGNVYYGYIIAMDVEYTRFSPGNAQVLLNIEWAYENGIEIFDFLAPADNYKFKWTHKNYAKANDVLLPMSVKGKFYGSIYLQKLRPVLKSAYIKLKNFKNKM